MLYSAVFLAGVLALTRPSNTYAAPTAEAPVEITGHVVYNVAAEHQHLFQSPQNTTKRSCASDYNTAALGTAAAMQSMYYNSAGYYQGGSGGGSAWTDVVSLASFPHAQHLWR